MAGEQIASNPSGDEGILEIFYRDSERFVLRDRNNGTRLKISFSGDPLFEDDPQTHDDERLDDEPPYKFDPSVAPPPNVQAQFERNLQELADDPDFPREY